MGVSQAGIIRMNLSVYLKFSIGFSPLPFPGAAVSPSPGARTVSALHCCPQQPAQSGPGTKPPSRRGRGEARVSQWLSAFPADSTRHSSLPAPHTASAPELSISFPQGEQPSHHPGCLVGIRGAASKRHLGTVPTGLAGSRSGRFESAVMDCLEYRSRCSQKGPGEDHLTGMWVTQQEGKGWEPDSPGPAGPRGGGQVVLPGRLSRGKRSCRRLKDK